MANIWEKTISILAGNLNLGRSYLITTVTKEECTDMEKKDDFKTRLFFAKFMFGMK